MTGEVTIGEDSADGTALGGGAPAAGLRIEISEGLGRI